LSIHPSHYQWVTDRLEPLAIQRSPRWTYGRTDGRVDIPQSLTPGSAFFWGGRWDRIWTGWKFGLHIIYSMIPCVQAFAFPHHFKMQS
jgi:hypothetical protein